MSGFGGIRQEKMVLPKALTLPGRKRRGRRMKPS